MYIFFSARIDTQSTNMHHTCIYVYAYTCMYLKNKTLKIKTLTLFASCDIQPTFSEHNRTVSKVLMINFSTLTYWHWSWIVEYGKRYIIFWEYCFTSPYMHFTWGKSLPDIFLFKLLPTLLKTDFPYYSLNFFIKISFTVTF